MQYQAVLRFHIWLTEMSSNLMFLRLMEIYDKSAAMMTSAMFDTRHQFPSTRVF